MHISGRRRNDEFTSVVGQHYLVHSFDDEFVTKCRSSQEGYSLKLEFKWYRKGTKIMKVFDTS